MDYLSYKAEDLALDASFQNYCLGTDQDDVLFWERWCEENPAGKPVVQQARELVLLLSGAHRAEQLIEDRQQFRSVVAAHFQKSLPKQSREAPVRKMGKYLFRAAVIVIAVGLVAALLTNRNHTGSSYKTLEISKAGEKKQFLLPDGTKVTMNAESHIDISNHFNTHSREIALNGEAFFEVVHNDKKPFIIHTPSMDIRVLGTTFNVKAYAEDSTTETSLIEGSIEISLNSKDKIVLKPNEKIVLPNTPADQPKNRPHVGEQSFVISPLTYDKSDSSLVEISWTESRLSFNDQSFEEIAKILERWYGARFCFKDETVKTFRFTATFEHKSMVQVLDALQLSRQFKYSINEKEIIIGR